MANELLGAACAGEVTEELVLRVETFPRLTSVRVHCPRNVQLRDDRGPLHDGRAHSLHRAATHVANGEDPLDSRLQRQRRSLS